MVSRKGRGSGNAAKVKERKGMSSPEHLLPKDGRAGPRPPQAAGLTKALMLKGEWGNKKKKRHNETVLPRRDHNGSATARGNN